MQRRFGVESLQGVGDAPGVHDVVVVGESDCGDGVGGFGVRVGWVGDAGEVRAVLSTLGACKWRLGLLGGKTGFHIGVFNLEGMLVMVWW